MSFPYSIFTDGFNYRLWVFNCFLSISRWVLMRQFGLTIACCFRSLITENNKIK